MPLAVPGHGIIECRFYDCPAPCFNMQQTGKHAHSGLSDWHCGQPDRLMVDTTAAPVLVDMLVMPTGAPECS